MFIFPSEQLDKGLEMNVQVPGSKRPGIEPDLLAKGSAFAHSSLNSRRGVNSASRRKTSVCGPLHRPCKQGRLDARLASALGSAKKGVLAEKIRWVRKLSALAASASRACGPTHAVRRLPFDPSASLLQSGRA